MVGFNNKKRVKMHDIFIHNVFLSIYLDFCLINQRQHNKKYK